MTPRFFVDLPLKAQASFDLPAAAARHVQVLRLQPGAAVTLFNGEQGEWSARVVRMGRSDVAVQVEAHVMVDRELPRMLTLAVGMPANERMDALIEKATELGVATVQPLLCERSVLRLSGERAAKKVTHWQNVAVAACEQSGRTRLLRVEPVMGLAEALTKLLAQHNAPRWLLSLAPDAEPIASMLTRLPAATGVITLSGPEGGLSPHEEALAREAGFVPVSLGVRTLRADTAPLAAAAVLALDSTAR